MNDVTIFSSGAVPATQRPLSALTQSIDTGPNLRRIQTNTNGTFRRLVGGEQMGKAISGAFNAIIVGMLPKVSRSYYANAYDPDAKPTLPDCWSNLGEVPEAAASNRQAASCSKCPQNIEGSGDKGKGRACRFQRRLAILLHGDPSGEVYQINVPAKSLFGKGNGITHPFESYVKFLVANQHSVDYVVTTIAYDLEADTMQLNFTPFSPINEAEYALVCKVQSDPETMKYTQLTVAAASGVTDAPKPQAQVQTQVFSSTPTPPPAPEPEPEVEAPPVKPPVPAVGAFDLSDETPAAEPEVTPPPTTRRTRKPKAEAEPAPVSNTLASVIDSWVSPAA
jgi:hypothetical protein